MDRLKKEGNIKILLFPSPSSLQLSCVYVVIILLLRYKTAEGIYCIVCVCERVEEKKKRSPKSNGNMWASSVNWARPLILFYFFFSSLVVC